MRTAIVDLDSNGEISPGDLRTAPRAHDRGLIAGLCVACAAFALAVWLARPAGPVGPAATDRVPLVTTAQSVGADPSYTSVWDRTGQQRLYTLALAPGARDVDLELLPERLANEAPPIEWRRVITVRGTQGVASDQGVQFISWSEDGILYWLSSASLTTDELIEIADDLR